MSKLESSEHLARASRLGPRLAMALVLASAGPWPAWAVDPVGGPASAVDPAGAGEPATATEAGDTAEATAAVAAALGAREPARPRKGLSALDRRVMLLTREFGLDSAQQARVRKALERQREQVVRVWNDASIPAARRVSATQAIGDQTADRIRAVLNEDQRKRYAKPRKRDVAVGAPGGSAESWMTKGQRQQPGAVPGRE